MTAPTAQASVAPIVTTPARALVPGANPVAAELLDGYPVRSTSVVTARLGTRCHPVKLEVPKASPSWRVRAEPGRAPPTAQRVPPVASEAEVSRSSAAELPPERGSERVASGAGTADHDVPFQCSVRVSHRLGA